MISKFHSHLLQTSHHGRQHLGGGHLEIRLDTVARLLILVLLPAATHGEQNGRHCRHDETDEVDVHEDDVEENASANFLKDGAGSVQRDEVGTKPQPHHVEGETNEEDDETCTECTELKK